MLDKGAILYNVVFVVPVASLSLFLPVIGDFTLDQWSSIATIVSVFGLGVLGAVVPFLKHIFKVRQKKKEKKKEELKDTVTEIIEEYHNPMIKTLTTMQKCLEENTKATKQVADTAQTISKEFNNIQKSVNTLKTESKFVKEVVMSNLGFRVDNRNKKDISDDDDEGRNWAHE